MSKVQQMQNVCGIYALYEPGSDKPVYIGQSVNIGERYRQHINGECGTIKGRWIKKLIADGGAPEIKILEVCSPMSLDAREKHWIDREFSSPESKTVNRRHVTKVPNVAPMKTQFTTGVDTNSALQIAAMLSGVNMSDIISSLVWRHIAENYEGEADIFRAVFQKKGMDFDECLAYRTSK